MLAGTAFAVILSGNVFQCGDPNYSRHGRNSLCTGIDTRSLAVVVNETTPLLLSIGVRPPTNSCSLALLRRYVSLP